MIKDKKEFKEEKRAKKSAVKNSLKQEKNTFSGIGDVISKDGKTFIDGITNLPGGEFDELYIDGICNCSNGLKAHKLGVEGVFNCDGNVETDELYCEGTSNIKGNVRAKEASIEGVTEIKGRLESDQINCEGVLRVAGEISADAVEARGVIFAREIVGDRIIIHSEIKSWLKPFLRPRRTVELIEATTITLHRVDAKTVNGHDIHIEGRCNIERIDCSGTLYVDESATVQEIVGSYERKY